MIKPRDLMDIIESKYQGLLDPNLLDLDAFEIDGELDPDDPNRVNLYLPEALVMPLRVLAETSVA